jgi:hypothetical protein
MSASIAERGIMSDEMEPAVSRSSMPPPLPPPMLGYATPLGLGAGTEGLWREGNRLITTSTATLPPRCVKCNALGTVLYRDRKFYWSTPWLLFLVLVNLLLYAIVVLIVRKKATLTFHLCQKHYRRRVMLMLTTSALALGALALMLGGPLLGDARRYGPLIVGGIVCGIFMILIAFYTGTLARVLTPVKITDRFAWFKGCSAEFLSDLSPTD